MDTKFQCPFCKDKTQYIPQDFSQHFIENHSNISPSKMTDWFRDKAPSKINKKTNKNNQFKA